MDFADNVKFIEDRYDEIGIIKGIEDAWDVYDTGTGDFVCVITQDGLDHLRHKGITTCGRSA